MDSRPECHPFAGNVNAGGGPVIPTLKKSQKVWLDVNVVIIIFEGGLQMIGFLFQPSTPRTPKKKQKNTFSKPPTYTRIRLVSSGPTSGPTKEIEKVQGIPSLVGARHLGGKLSSKQLMNAHDDQQSPLFHSRKMR